MFGPERKKGNPWVLGAIILLTLLSYPTSQSLCSFSFSLGCVCVFRSRRYSTETEERLGQSGWKLKNTCFSLCIFNLYGFFFLGGNSADFQWQRFCHFYYHFFFSICGEDTSVQRNNKLIAIEIFESVFIPLFSRPLYDITCHIISNHNHIFSISILGTVLALSDRLKVFTWL